MKQITIKNKLVCSDCGIDADLYDVDIRDSLEAKDLKSSSIIYYPVQMTLCLECIEKRRSL